MKHYLVLIMLLSLTVTSFARLNFNADFRLGTNPKANHATFYEFLDIGFSYYTPIELTIEAYLKLSSDGKFPDFNAGSAVDFTYYLMLKNSGIRYKNDYINLKLGYYPIEDEVLVPYSLFFNSNPISKPIIDFKYEDNFLYFHYAWMLINGHGKDGSEFYKDKYKETYDKFTGNKNPREKDIEGNELFTGDKRLAKGLNYRSFGFNFDKWSFGYQDVAVYNGTIFDYYYALIPLPSIILEHIRNLAGGKRGNIAPWDESINDSAKVGFFVKYEERDLFMTYFQFLLDDFPAGLLVGKTEGNGPAKFAWSFGGNLKTHYGNFGLYHAGALKYTFQTWISENYAYTHYPFLMFMKKGKLEFVDAEDLYIGYKNGENNLAFLFTYERNFDLLYYGSSLEISLTGSQSPSSAFGEYYWGDYHNGDLSYFVLFGGSGVEKKFSLKNSFKYPLLDWLELFFQADFIMRFNALKLSTDFKIEKGSENSKKKRYYPFLAPSDEHKFSYDVYFGVKVNLDLFN